MDTLRGPDVLKRKYGDLHTSIEVSSAVRRAWLVDGEKVSEKPNDRIQNYLDRFRTVLETKNQDGRQRGLELIKGFLHHKIVIKKDQIPDSYWENQKRIIRERGQGAYLGLANWEEVKNETSQTIIADQIESLDLWVNYLSSDEATYPDWLKYYAMRSVIGMGNYDREKHSYTKRDAGTTQPFPELNREALAYVLDALQKKYSIGKADLDDLEPQDREQFEKLLKGENFAKLYAWSMEKTTPKSFGRLDVTTGVWKKYDRNSDHIPLVKSIQGYGTGWCTAGESTAEAQLEAGDFYVYYSDDETGEPTIPRVAIRMEHGDGIAEVRGIAKDQNLDPYIGDVVKEKLSEFGEEGEMYEKRVADMKFLTDIENKTKNGRELDRNELIFLHEINSSIEGFGYLKDPRIEELKSARNLKEDVAIILELNPNQIAWGKDQITSETKVYIGKLYKGIFDKLDSNFQIYTSFPEGKIKRETITIGGISLEEFEERFSQAGIKLNSGMEDLFNNGDYALEKGKKEQQIIILKASDLLGFAYTTTKQVYIKAIELGLKPCSTETALQLRLNHLDQSKGEGFSIITGQDFNTNEYEVFNVMHQRYTGLKLSKFMDITEMDWDSDNEFVFTTDK